MFEKFVCLVDKKIYFFSGFEFEDMGDGFEELLDFAGGEEASLESSLERRSFDVYANPAVVFVSGGFFEPFILICFDV